ncbi:hypothetical protein H181DRAFT_01844 [Streptomyces sp. WMMB 714]|uniref:hypothetical protein n=1 Tax=Streptomyces sp. WMMB 714 TaxID=1286822 RepID=UPI0005F81885|nr:hypothetical protein [Streptomyces sp. WMMB 714]SCK24346.1 hypothetical protein H181DRAFT_01844 [Streptomyces sp. WMMB 714]
MSTLEQRYRRLLRLYPRPHRHVHGEEMLAVLLECAAPGQERISAADGFDLVQGALKVRWRRLQGVFGPQWSDALAVVSLIAPLLMLACSSNPMVGVVADGDFDPRPMPGVPFDPTQILVSFYVVGWAFVVLTGAAGRRWASAAAATVLATMALVFRVADIARGHWSDFLDPPLILTGLIAATALIASPGPRRGARIIGLRGTLLAVTAATLLHVLNHSLDYASKAPHLGMLPYLLLFFAVFGRPEVQMRFAALTVPHVAGAATFFLGIGTGLFTTDGDEALLYDEAYYSAYAVSVLCLLSLLFLLKRARAAGAAARDTGGPQEDKDTLTPC